MQGVADRNELSDMDVNAINNEFADKRLVDWMAEFAAGAGHELNNPLAIISGLAQNLLKRQSDPGIRTACSTIIAQVGRAHEMIADVRAFARPPMPEPGTFDVGTFFERWTRSEKLRDASKTENVEIYLDEKCRELKIETDEALLLCILNALGKNSFEAISEDGSLYYFCNLRLKTNGNENASDGEWILEIGVENNGPNMSEQDLQLMYAPFFSGRQAGRGLGFGLSKAWRFAEVLGAELVCERSSRFAKGRRWAVEIPVQQ